MQRPWHPRDERDREAWSSFADLLAAANAGRTDRARAIVQRLADWGYRVEQIGATGFRLVLPEQWRVA